MLSERYRSTRDMVDALQERGSYTFTLNELRSCVSGSDAALQQALRRLGQRGRLFRPRRGFYVVVPIEYRLVGTPPASWFIDQLMSYIGQPYYVGLLTAAAHHGASHQSPQVFQVLTTRPLRPVRSPRIGIRFYVWSRTESVPAPPTNTPTGTMRVSTPEFTALDLIRRPGAGGYLSNVATVVAELADRIDGPTLLAAAKLYRRTDMQRLGYVLEVAGKRQLADLVSTLLPRSWARLTPLRPGRVGAASEVSRRWGLLINERIEPDL